MICMMMMKCKTNKCHKCVALICFMKDDDGLFKFNEGRDMTAQDVCVKKKSTRREKHQTNHFYRGKKLR